MALTATDWTIDRSTKEFEYIGADHDGAATYATVIEFHRWAQALADNAVAIASSGDELDITNTDPSKRSTDNIITMLNGYKLKEDGTHKSHEFLYDGSIIEDDGDRIYDGIVNFGNATVVIQILQDGAVITDDWWNLAGPVGVNPDSNAGISHRFMVKTREDGVDIDGRRLIGTTRVMDTGAGTSHKTFKEFKINGTARGNNVLALVNGGDLNNTTSETAISGWTDITNTEGLNLIDVDADGSDEEYYSKWDTSGSHEQNDYYERLKWLSRDGSSSTIGGMSGEVFRGITHNLAWDADAGTQPVTNDYVVWGTNVVFSSGSGTFEVGEAIHEDTAIPQWKGRIIAIDDDTGTGSLIIAVESGVVETTDQFTCQNSSATGTVNGTPTAVTGGGTYVCLAVDDDGSAGNLYIQVVKGTISADDAILYNAGTDLTAIDIADTLTQNLAAEDRTIETPFIGASTGSNIVGAYGIGFETDQIDDSDILTALDGSQYSRPNLVTNTVGGLSQDGDDDRVFVAPWDGTSYDVNGDPETDKGQLLLSTALTTDDVASIVVKTGTETAIPTDTPSSGTIRVTDDDGFERWIPYSSWTGTTFTVNTGHGDIGSNNDFGGAQGSGTYQASVDNEIYITYIDENAATTTLTFQSTYDAPRDLLVVVRNGDATAPIKQFIAEWSLTSSNQTLNAIRTTDL